MSVNATLQVFAVVMRETQSAANNLCPACYSGDQPIQDEDGRWWHEEYDDNGEDVEDRECDAEPLWNALARIAAGLDLPFEAADRKSPR